MINRKGKITDRMEARQNLFIRAYEPADWEAVCTIFAQAKPDEFKGVLSKEDIIPMEEDEAILKSFHDSAIYVAEKDNRIVGFAGYHNQFISFLFISPHHYRQHIATRLLEHILPMAGNEVSLLVLKSNLPAINLYRKLGFTIAEEFNGKYNESITVTVLRLSKTQVAF